MKQATVNIFHDTRNNVNTLKIVVTWNRLRHLFTTGFKINEKSFTRLKLQSFKAAPDGKIKDDDFLELWNALFSRKEEKEGMAIYANRLAHELGANFNIKVFRERFENYGKEPIENVSNKTNILSALFEKEKYLRNKGNVKTGITYGLAAKSFLAFINSMTNEEKHEFGISVKSVGGFQDVEMHYNQLTIDFLTCYEQFMMSNQKSPTTVGIYLRSVRALYNEAIAEGLIALESYPFGKRKYSIPSAINSKLSLTKDQIEQIVNYEPSNDYEKRSWNMFLFSYYSNGMNFVDILNLKWKNINLEADKFTFVRQKTMNKTKGKEKKVVAILNQKTKAIIEEYGSDNKRPESYVFPFFESNMDEERKVSIRNQLNKVTNKYLKRIAKNFNFETKLTTYTARHSFATILLRSNVSTSFIQQSLGHASIATTEAYLGSFEDEQTKEYLANL